ncbi:MAG: hypothetical protein JKY59_09800 [Emcibacter sp.]|nr:hypothetical protein [Emcibacter sp.]
MVDHIEEMNMEQADAALEEALTRLERAVLNSEKQEQVSTSEQAIYIEQLEAKNIQLSRDQEEMKRHCIALKKSYEALEAKCKRLENANDSAEKELTATLHDLDQIIAQKSLH